MGGGSIRPREVPDFPRAKGSNRSYKVVYRGTSGTPPKPVIFLTRKCSGDPYSRSVKATIEKRPLRGGPRGGPAGAGIPVPRREIPDFPTGRGIRDFPAPWQEFLPPGREILSQSRIPCPEPRILPREARQAPRREFLPRGGNPGIPGSGALGTRSGRI